MNKLAVVALGGNAILRGDEEGTVEQQEENARETLENLVHLLNEDYELVITHGNGPQVGNKLMRNDAGEQMYNIAPMPLDICVADSQGGIGYMIERILRNILNKHGIIKEIVSLITLVEVQKNDPALKNPKKRIGKIYKHHEAQKLEKEKGWVFKSTAKNDKGFRRVVPSPTPVSILNKKTIEQLVQAGNIVIAAGGGGIPVYFDNQKNMRTVDAVIDKDMASSLLATNTNAEEFYVLTDVPFIYNDFGKETQKKLEFLNYKDAMRYLNVGTFAEGTMEPKIKACLNFIKKGGKKSIITEAKKLEDKSYGSKITMEYEN